MFFPGSRYAKADTVTVVRADGTSVTAIKIPTPAPRTLLGYHRRLEEQRLDLIASYYLQDATAFWQLCDANDAVSPDALQTRDLIGIPVKDS